MNPWTAQAIGTAPSSVDSTKLRVATYPSKANRPQSRDDHLKPPTPTGSSPWPLSAEASTTDGSLTISQRNSGSSLVLLVAGQFAKTDKAPDDAHALFLFQAANDPIFLSQFMMGFRCSARSGSVVAK